MNAYQEFRMIGSRPIRPDGLDKVTGRARYGADLNMQGQIYGHVVRSPHAHAVIQSIDCSKALAMEGVLAVMTGDDLVTPGNEMLGSGEGAMALKDVVPMVMSQGKVLFHSQAVAAVAATSPELAAEAARAVEVVYEVQPAVTDVHKALADGAPVLHDDRFPDGYPEEPTNLATHISLTVGDPDAAFEKAEVVIEQTYSVPMCHQGYIEPHACVAADADAAVVLHPAFLVAPIAQDRPSDDIDLGKIPNSAIGIDIGGKPTAAATYTQKAGRREDGDGSRRSTTPHRVPRPKLASPSKVDASL